MVALFLPERFRAQIKVDAGGCWLWTGELNDRGYPRFWPGGGHRRRVRAHRFAYQCIVGEIPEGLELHHTCEVRTCVNPLHLEPLTHCEHIRGHVARRQKKEAA